MRALKVQKHQLAQINKHGSNGFVIATSGDKYNHEGIPNAKTETPCKYIFKTLNGSEKIPTSVGEADARITIPSTIQIEKGDEFKTFDNSIWSVELPNEQGVVQNKVMTKVVYLTRI